MMAVVCLSVRLSDPIQRSKDQRSKSLGRLMLRRKMCHIFRTGRARKFKVGVRMKYDDSHHRDVRWSQRLKVKASQFDACLPITWQRKVAEAPKSRQEGCLCRGWHCTPVPRKKVKGQGHQTDKWSKWLFKSPLAGSGGHIAATSRTACLYCFQILSIWVKLYNVGITIWINWKLIDKLLIKLSRLIEYFLSRVSMLMHAERDIVIPILSVHLSVCPSVRPSVQCRYYV